MPWSIYEIGDLRFLSGAISQKRTEIVDFTDFYETFWSECRKRMQRPKWTEKTSHENQETSTILALFCEITLHLKNLNVTDLVWDANLAVFSMSEPPQPLVKVSKTGVLVYLCEPFMRINDFKRIKYLLKNHFLLVSAHEIGIYHKTTFLTFLP